MSQISKLAGISLLAHYRTNLIKHARAMTVEERRAWEEGLRAEQPTRVRPARTPKLTKAQKKQLKKEKTRNAIELDRARRGLADPYTVFSNEGQDMSHINFKVTREEAEIILKIAERWHSLCRKHGRTTTAILDTTMDLTATHANNHPLRLQELLEADDFNFSHDVGGIYHHMNRETGKLEGCFFPRFSVPAPAVAQAPASPG